MKMNWNTLILTAQATVIWYFGRDLIKDVRATHDAVLVMKAQMVDHRQYDVEISDIRARLTAVEVDIQKLKQERK